ncbi:FACT complex subunit SSRP1-like isoform X3 [Durio zibethinus]|uniref:FACT complex subunit SSRP1 n=1 Tax=Durio zibethinus TaxID=66656 RepID=A0A6P5YH67_DURZI|nr:FACT complex subunit SSRP1-like isoform X3 [Durio zibethinus]
MTDGHLFNNISLGGRGGTNPGQLKIYSGGILWKKQGGGKAVEVDKSDILGVTWMKVPRTNQLGVRIKDGLYYKFTGFRDQDVASLTSFFNNNCGITPEEKQLSVSGHNWGEVDLNGNMLTFVTGSKQAFEVSLADVSQTQLQGKNDVILEFHVDDTTGANEFETDYVVQSSLSINEDLLNTKYKDRLEPSYKGLIHEVFTTIMRGLSGAKVTKPGKFRSCQDGYAVKSSLKAEDGVLYPLEKSFFFLPKPPTLILHEEIAYVEFERHAAGSSNMHYFDLLIRLKTEQEHLFRNIQRNEYHNLFDFISLKGLKIMNLGDVRTTDGVAEILKNEDDDAVDPHLERIKNEAGGDESDEEDEDFVVDKDDGGSPTDDSGEEESNASESGDEKEKPAKKDPRKEASSASSKATKKKAKDGQDDGKKKKRKKKDPNAPKRAMSGFMFFSQVERENLKKSNPGASFTEVSRILGEKWKKLSEEEKEPYEAKAKLDRKRYDVERNAYKNPQPMNIDSGNESDSA